MDFATITSRRAPSVDTPQAACGRSIDQTFFRFRNLVREVQNHDNAQGRVCVTRFEAPNLALGLFKTEDKS
jgi:hypothetical protein